MKSFLDTVKNSLYGLPEDFQNAFLGKILPVMFKDFISQLRMSIASDYDPNLRNIC